MDVYLRLGPRDNEIMAWSQVRDTVAEFLSPPDGLILFCGMSIGYEDPTVSYARTGRAPLDETVKFVAG